MQKGKNKISNFKRKWILIGVLVFLAGQLLVPIIVLPQHANALPTEEVGPQLGLNFWDKIWKNIKDTIKKVGAVAFKNAAKTFANNLAYNAAVQITTGEKGQKPLFTTQPEKILKQAADVAAGDFLDSVAGDWLGKSSCLGYYGDQSCKSNSSCPPPILDCDPANLTQSEQEQCASSPEAMDLCLARGCTVEEIENRDEYNELSDGGYIKVGGDYIPGAPKCNNDFSLCDQTDLFKVNINIKARASIQPTANDSISGKCQVTDIIDAMENNISDAKNLYKDLTNKEKNTLYLQQIAKGFNPEASELGAFITISNQTKAEVAKASKNKEFSEKLSGGLSSVTSKITGAVKTPGPLLEGAINSTFGTSLDVQNTFTGEIVADAIGTFTSTLASKMMSKYFSGLADEEISNGGGSSLLGGLLGGIRSGVTAAKLIFADLKQVNYSVGGNLDILSSLAGCPDSDNPTPDTCVIDSRFSTAIQQQLTVREAIEAGLLDGNKTFGFDLNGNQPEYYNGYPYRSLVILRKYRVIPVGWELAADYMKEFAPGSYSLNILIEQYDDSDSPFYHLVDPNWVLKAPAVYCARQGAGEKIEFNEPIRSEDTNKDSLVDDQDAAISLVTRNSNYCADEQLCLIENDDGSCKKFGYCVEEKPIWKFTGTACEEQYNSCQSFGSGLAYLTNTLDYNGCNSGNAGCQWYCQDYDLASEDWQCTNQDPPSGGSKISFNGQAESCSATGEGCSEFISIANSGANLVKNSGFEEFDTTADSAKATDGVRDTGIPIPAPFNGTSLPDDFIDWTHDYVNGTDPCQQRSLASNDAFGGLTAARMHQYPDCSPVDGNYMTQVIDTGYLTDNRTFTASFYAKRAEGGTCNDANDDLSIQMNRDFAPGDTQYLSQPNLDVPDNWTRFALTFNFDSQPSSRWSWPTQAEIDYNKRVFTLFVRHNNSGCDILIDNIQVEEGGLTDYKAYEDSPKTYLKKAPDYLNCTGSVFDNEACQNFAQYCSADEIGCQEYTSDRTGQSVMGTITNINICDPNDPASCDQCPAEFVGCQAYRELATENVPYRPAVDPVSFVESTGLSCPASAVGCEEYTNLDVVAQGGEGKEYFSWIKQCVNEDDPNIATYYTWEGSDEFGFQLKDYKLKISNIDAGPCTNMAPEDPYLATLGLGWNNCIDDASVDRDADGTDDEFYPMAYCTLADVGVNPDCAEFIDTLGNRFYRLKSKIIYADADCKIYRNSIDSGASCQAGLCTNTNSVCTTDATCTDILYHLVPNQGNSCQAEYAGCRAYKGNAGDNTRIIYEEDFENGNVGVWAGGQYSNESVSFGGHSILATSAISIVDTLNDANIDFEIGKSYNISFWAKAGVTNTPIQFNIVDSSSLSYTFPGQAVAKTDEWNYYKLGPLYITNNLTDPVSLITNLTSPVYFDNFSILEIVDNIYLVKDSYTECAGYENCDRYTDRPGNTNYLKSFSGLCSEDKIGCEAMIDTQNSSIPGELVYDVANGVTETIPADVTTTIVNDPNKRCGAGEKGCEKLGKPTLDENGIVTSYDETYIKNDPDKYDNYLCSFEESGCNEYTTPEGSKYYFKDPGANICEYKKVAGQTISGWYKKSTNSGIPDCPVTVGVCKDGPAPIPPAIDNDDGKACGSHLDCDSGLGTCATGYCEDNNALCFDNNDCAVNIECIPAFNVVPQPNGAWTGSCPENASTCTEYRDPESPSFSNPFDPALLDYCDMSLVDGGGDGQNSYDCDSYYYLSNDIDETSCNGLVDREEGCLLFNDTNKDSLNYYADETKNGSVPEVCDNTVADQCDSNLVVKVDKDRTCARWIDSATTLSEEGNGDGLSTSINICEEMDQQTTACVSWDTEISDTNQTYSTPSFVDKIKNYSGLVLGGLDWERRCDDNSNIICTSDADCGGATPKCSDPQIIEGNLPVTAMQQVGSIGFNGDLIPNGDFGDSDYNLNQKLSCPLSGGDTDCDIKRLAGVFELDSSDFPTELSRWSPRIFNDSTPNIYWTEESAKGLVPSQNGNLDENNILKVSTQGYVGPLDGNATGVSYNLGRSIVKDMQYTVSFKIKWGGAPSIYDKIRVELEYKDQAGNLQNWNQGFAADIIPTDNWKEYVLGPIPAGYDEGITELTSFGDVSLNIIHIYDTVNGGTVPGVTFYLDDVNMEPVLTIKNGTCKVVDETLEVAYNTAGLAGKQCNSISDCVAAPGFIDGDVKCAGLENVAKSCRLYPKNDARYCNYVDVNRTTFQGWNGYCLERDPGNSNFCINWWPVDLLKGDSDVFGTLAPFNLKIRQPLYMCLEAEGNYNKPIGGDISFGGKYVLDARSANNSVRSSCSNANPNVDDNYRGVNSSYYLLGEGNPNGIQEFGYRRPMASLLYNHGGNTVGSANNHCTSENDECCWMGPVGAGDTGFIMANDCADGNGCEIHPGNSSSSTECSTDVTTGCGSSGWFSTEDEYYKWEIDSINFVMNRWSHPDYESNRIDTLDGPSIFILNDQSTCLNPLNNCWSGTWSSGGSNPNSITISVSFNNNDLLTGYSVYALDGQNGGGAWVQGIFHLREKCTRIVEVNQADNTNKAWASKINTSSAYSVPDLLYKYSQHYVPYGGIVQPTPITSIPSQWTYVPNNIGPIYVENRSQDPSRYAHAGSPYSFIGNSSGRICSANVAGDGYPSQNECRGKKDVEACLAGPDGDINTIGDNGYCIGVGQGFCEKDPTLYCSLATEVPDGDCIDSNLNDQGPCIVGGGGAANIHTPTEGMNRIRLLFANTFGAWLWNNDLGIYEVDPIQSDNNTAYNNMPLCPAGVIRDPNVYCGIPPVVDMTFSNSNGKIFNLGDVGGRVQFNIDINADKDQLPINYIYIDWNIADGVSEDQILVGPFDSGSFVIDHVYTRSGANSFQPAIKVVDNWDWCGVASGQVCDQSSSSTDCRDLLGYTCNWVNPGLTINVGP